MGGLGRAAQGWREQRPELLDGHGAALHYKVEAEMWTVGAQHGGGFILKSAG